MRKMYMRLAQLHDPNEGEESEVKTDEVAEEVTDGGDDDGGDDE